MIVGTAGSCGNLPDPFDERACGITETRQHSVSLGSVPLKKRSVVEKKCLTGFRDYEMLALT